VKKIKRLLCLNLCVFSLVSVASCSGDSSSDITSEIEASTSSTSESESSVTLEGSPVITASDFSFDKGEYIDVLEYVSITDDIDADISEKIVVTADTGIIVDNHYISCEESGEYQVNFSVVDSDGNAAAKSVEVTVYSPYNVFALNATMPPLFSLSTLVSDDTPSLVWLERKGTFDFDNLPVNVIASWEANQSDATLCASTFTLLLEKVKEIGDADVYSRFTLYRDDVRADLDLYMFLSQGITEDRYQVKMVPDGGWSYNSAVSSYVGENTYAAFIDNKNTYLEKVEDAREGKLNVSDAIYNGATFSTSTIAMAQRSNFEYLLQYPEYISSKDERVQAEIDSANITEAKPDEMYNSLTEDQKEQFRTILSLNKDVYDSTYFTATDERPYLIITGTNPVTGSLTNEQFENVVDQIISKYGDEYNFAFKPHPAALLSSNQVIKDYFAEKNIVELPGRLPMEALTWVYNSYALGGFDSSLYMCVPTGNTKFFICASADNLSIVTKNLYDAGLYGDCDFIQPTI